jgi:hypothetical protein
LHLNRVPRARRHPCVPIEAVGRLLSSGHRGQGAASQERED